MPNPGPSISERAQQLSRERGITFQDAIRELSRRGARKRRSNKARDRRESERRDAAVSALERRGLF